MTRPLLAFFVLLLAGPLAAQPGTADGVADGVTDGVTDGAGLG